MWRIILFLFIVTRSFATTYYVDYDAGNDSNNGTSTSTPFKRCPGMATFTGGITLQSGDIVNFKGGVIHILDSSISARAGVTYDGNAWGIGVAILDGQNTTGTGFSLDSTDNNVVIRDMQIQNFGGYAEDNPVWTGVAISSIDTSTNVITTATPHNLVVGDDIQLTRSTGATWPSPLTGGPKSNTKYYVISAPTAETFTISASSGGSIVDITTAGTGTFTVWEPVTAPPGGNAINASSGSDNLTVANVVFTEIGQWMNTVPMSGTGSVSGQGVALQGNIGATITGCSFSKMHNPISVKVNSSTGGLIQDILIEDCDITRAVWGVDISPRAVDTTLRNIEIRNCRISNFSEYDSGGWLGFGEKPHTDMIFARVNYRSVWENLKIHGNTFYQDGSPSGSGGTAAIYLSAGAPALVYNNVFYRVFMTRVIEITPLSQLNGKQVVRLYNNLFYQGGISILTDYETDPLKKEVYIQNNIFVRDGASNSLNIARNNASVLPVVLNNNLYYSNTFSETEKQIIKLNVTGNLAVAQAAGWELDGDWGNPLLLDTDGDYDDANLRIGDGSAAIGLGANLSEFFTTDKDGNARPTVGVWDVGPYVYDATPPLDTTAPTLLSATVNSQGSQLTMVFDEPIQGVSASHYSISGHTVSDLSASGDTVILTLSPVVYIGDVKTLGYTSGVGRTRDLSDNLLATFSNFSIVNNSLELTPLSAKPSKMGRSGRGLLNR